MPTNGSKIMELNLVKNHIRNRPYMGGIIRDADRVKESEEIFTPTLIVQESLDLLELECPNCFKDPEKTFLDNCCGDGQFLGEILIRKMENGIDFRTALLSIYGVDIMLDNVERCRKHLLCGREEFRYIVDKNIVCNDALDYHYKFDDTTSTSHIEAMNLPVPNKIKTPKKKIEIKEVENNFGSLF